MIKVARLKSQEEFILNAELIETIEETPDTVITLISGRKLIVEDSMDQVVRKIMDYRRAILGKFR